MAITLRLDKGSQLTFNELDDNFITLDSGKVANTVYFNVDVAGNVTANTISGDTSGTHTGPVVGDVTGNTAGTHTGAVVGNVTGDTAGTHTGNVVSTAVESDHYRLGNVTVGAANTTITAGQMFIANTASVTVTLPASPSTGDTVYIGVGDFTDTIIGRNGENIMSTAEDLTIDAANLTLTLTYINSAIGWRIY